MSMTPADIDAQPPIVASWATRNDILPLLLVIIVAAVLRLYRYDMSEFQQDESLLSLRALDMVSGVEFPLVGIRSSVGIPNPPTSVYVVAIPFALSRDPLVATVFIIVLNVIGVGLVWFIARRYIDPLVAFLSALIYAIDPWAVLHSRKIWAQDFHTPLILLALLLGLYGFLEGKRLAQLLCLPILIFALQFHFAAWALLPLYLWLVWAGRKRLSWRALTGSFLLTLIVLTPFLIGLSKTLNEDSNLVAGAVAKMNEQHRAPTDALVEMSRLATGFGVETWSAPQQQAELLAAAPPSPLWAVLGIATLAGIIGVWAVAPRPIGVLLLLWVLFPLALFTPTWTKTYSHYFVASIPALNLLAGVSIAWLLRTVPTSTPGRALIGAGLGVILFSQAYWWTGFLKYVDIHQTPDGFGTPFHYLSAIRDKLGRSDDVVVITSTTDIRFSKVPTIWRVLLYNTARCTRAIGDNPALARNGTALIPVNGQFAVLFAPDASDNPFYQMYRTDNSLAMPLRSGEGAYKIAFFDKAPAWAGPPLAPLSPVQFTNGVQLVGYHLEANRLFLEWILPGSTSTDYYYFGHFLNAKGERVGQRDAPLWPGRYWCAGDHLVTWVDINLPNETTTLRTGLYRLDQGHYINSDVTDASGNLMGQWTDIPLTNSKARR